MNFFGKRILFLGAHPDDIELGCGAFLHRIVQKTDVLCVTLSDNQKNPDLQNVKSEHFRSMEVLGVPKEKIVLGQFTTRVFPDSRQEILEYFLKLRKDFKPDLIFIKTRRAVSDSMLLQSRLVAKRRPEYPSRNPTTKRGNHASATA